MNFDDLRSNNDLVPLQLSTGFEPLLLLTAAAFATRLRTPRCNPLACPSRPRTNSPPRTPRQASGTQCLVYALPLTPYHRCSFPVGAAVTPGLAWSLTTKRHSASCAAITNSVPLLRASQPCLAVEIMAQQINCSNGTSLHAPDPCMLRSNLPCMNVWACGTKSKQSQI
jgi:hypothetical protein